MRKIKILVSFILIISMATFLFGFSKTNYVSQNAYKLLKKSFKNGETVERLNYKKFLTLQNYKNIFYLDDKGYLEPVSDNYVFNKKHIVFRFIQSDTKLFSNNTDYKPITNVKKYLEDTYGNDYIISRIKLKNINQVNKQKCNIVDDNTKNNLTISDLYKIGEYRQKPSNYGGCGPVAEYILMQYIINNYGYEQLLQKRVFKERNIDYLEENTENYFNDKSQEFIKRLKFADFIYENIETNTGKDPGKTSTWSYQMIAGIYNTINALGLQNVISANRTNIFQQRVWRIKNNIDNGFPSLVWTLNQAIAENNHWFVTHGYEVWEVKNQTTGKSFNITFLKVTSDSEDGSSTYVDENKLTGIWGMIEVRVKNNKFFHGNEFNLIENRYYEYKKTTSMKNRLNETLDIEYERAGYIQSYYRPHVKDGMFNTLSSHKNGAKSSNITIKSNSGITGITFNIAKWGEKEYFDSSYDYVQILADGKEVYRFNLDNIYNSRYMLDLEPFYMDFGHKVYNVTLEVKKNSSYYNNWNRGRVVIDNLIVNE